MKIKIINPNTTEAMTRSIGEAGRSVAREGTEIVCTNPEFGPESIESYYDEYMAAPGTIDEVLKGDRDGCDAFVIACYGDPGLQGAREATAKPVLGIGEASLYTASMLAARFSVVTVIPRIRTMIEEMVAGYGFAHKCVSVRTTPYYVLDIERDPDGALQALRDEARRAMEEDTAEAILLGCAGFASFAADLERELGIPVLDGVVCAVKLAEALVDLGKATSRHFTYRPPEAKRFTGMFQRFGSGSPGQSGGPQPPEREIGWKTGRIARH
ncbi:MAG: aspartate/glutamate racemase family protein [Alphaproteobacteria bacterium]